MIRLIVITAILAFLAFLAVTAYVILIGRSPTEEERYLDDEAQMKYLAEWQETHGKDKQGRTG